MKNFDELNLLDEFLFLNVMIRNQELLKTFISMAIKKDLRKVEVTTEFLSESAMVINAIGDEEYDIYFKFVSKDNIAQIRRYYEYLLMDKYTAAKINRHHAKKSFLLLISTDDSFLDNQCKHTIVYECKEAPSVTQSFPETIIYYPYGEKNDMDSDLVEFMDYLVESSVKNEYTAAVEEALKKVKENELLEEEYYSSNIMKRVPYRGSGTVYGCYKINFKRSWVNGRRN